MSVRRSTRLAAVVVPVAIALVVTAVLQARGAGDRDDPGGAGTTGDTTGETVDLDASDTVPVASLADMVAAAECVAAGEVVHTERGRPIGAGLVSRLVQVRVDEAPAGTCPEGTVVIEEEGWLADGAEVTVEGWPGSAEGDRGVWFLVPGTSDELPYAATVATSGALRWRDGRALVPAEAPDWVRASVADGEPALVDRVEEVAATAR